MSSVDSTLEALAFDYLSIGFIATLNSLWTWLAVLTAALSFWRIRVSGSNPGSPATANPPPMIQSPSIREQGSKPKEVAVVPPARPSSVSANENDGVTKGKFTMYYGEAGRKQAVANDIHGGCSGELNSFRRWREETSEWEIMLKTRMANLEWYAFQDLTALNGNVVRLWDGGSRCGNSVSSYLLW